MALAAVLPLLVGVGLAFLTGMWMFLAFTAVSGVSVLVPFLSGRRQRREFQAAVAGAALQDRERRRHAAPSAADLTISCAAAVPPTARAPGGEPPDICLRLGLAEQSANIRPEPPDAGFRPPPLGQVPLTLDPVPAVVTVHGPAPATAGLMRSFILQLAAYPLAESTRLLLHGPADTVPLPARFLPGVTLSANDATTAAVLAGDPGGSRQSRRSGVPAVPAVPGIQAVQAVLRFLAKDSTAVSSFFGTLRRSQAPHPVRALLEPARHSGQWRRRTDGG